LTPEALHSSNTDRWLTPPDVIEAARKTMDGVITLDPASEDNGNKIVRAEWFYSELNNGLSEENAWHGNVWLNPPGDKRGELPKRFWLRLLNEWNVGNVKQACFLLFTLNQIQTLQDVVPPTNYPTLFFRKRLKFLNADTLQPANQPAQANALVYLPPKTQNAYNSGSYAVRFKENFGKYGAISIPR
jgi:DNA N-6-adenine-methyltransferase (Dam)